MLPIRLAHPWDSLEMSTSYINHSVQTNCKSNVGVPKALEFIYDEYNIPPTNFGNLLWPSLCTNKDVLTLRYKNFTIRQIERFTGINRMKVQRILAKHGHAGRVPKAGDERTHVVNKGSPKNQKNGNTDQYGRQLFKIY